MKPHGRRVKPVKPRDSKKKRLLISLESQGFTGFTRLPCGFIQVSDRFQRFHTPANRMLCRHHVCMKPTGDHTHADTGKREERELNKQKGRSKKGSGVCVPSQNIPIFISHPPPPSPKLTHTRARSLKVSVKNYHPRGRHLAQTVAHQLWIWGEGGHARKPQVPGWYFISQTPESVLGAQIFEQVQHKLMYANTLGKGPVVFN